MLCRFADRSFVAIKERDVMSKKAFRILTVGAGIVLGCTLVVAAQQQAIGPSRSRLLMLSRKTAPEPARYRVFALKRISVEQGKKYLTDAKIGMVSQLPGVNMLLVSAQRPDLNKASAILKLVDSTEEYAVKTLTGASQVEVLPSNEEIAKAVGDITIGTFSNPPAGKTESRAIIDIHDGALMAIAPAGQLERIVAAIERLRISLEDGKAETQQLEPPKMVHRPEGEMAKWSNDAPSRRSALKQAVDPNIDAMIAAELKRLQAASSKLAGRTAVADPNADKLFNKLLSSLAEAEKELAQQTEPTSEISKAIESISQVSQPNEPSPDITTESQPQPRLEALERAEPNTVAALKELKTLSMPSVISSQTEQMLPEGADGPPRQVMLETRIVELTAQAKEKLGVDWTSARQGHSPGQTIRKGDIDFSKMNTTIEIGCLPAPEFTNRLLPMLALLCEDNSAAILANPCVTVIDTQQAQIEFTTEDYFKITTGPAHSASAGIETVKSGILLKMTPRIQASGEITLQVSPEVSDVVGVGPQGLPRVTRRKAATTVRLKNGGTVVIGGLVNNTTQDTTNKVLLLGYLSKSTTATQTTRDVLIFITPRLLGEDGRPEPLTTAVD